MKIFKMVTIFLGVIFIAITLLVCAAFLIIRNVKAPELLEREIEKGLGIEISVEKMSFSPLLTMVKAEGVTIYNPAGFDEKELAYIDSVTMVWDPLRVLLYKKVDIYLLALNLKRLNVIKNLEGKVNIKELVPAGKADPSPEEKADPSPAEVAPFSFDVLVLSVGEVTYTEYGSGIKKTHHYPINIADHAFVNLKDGKELVRLVIYNALMNTDVGKLVNLTIQPVVANVSGVVASAMGTAKAGTRSAWEIVTLPVKWILGE